MERAEQAGPMNSARRLRVLLAGEWQAEIHEAAWKRGLEELGHQVTGFGWFSKFASGHSSRLEKLAARIQNKLLAGPRIEKLNRDLLDEASALKPEVILLYRPTHIRARTISELKRRLPDAVIATFNNDDAFSPRASPLLWRHYRGVIKEADINLAYRTDNLADLRTAGARGVHLLRSYYLPWRDHPVPVTDAERARLGADILFAGHYEDDGRLAYLEALASSGLDIKLFGPDWKHAPSAPFLERFQPIQPLGGADYVKAISASRIALCLFSGLNRDTYTRRCFEIPAIGAVLLCQRTAEMGALYGEGVEAEYFDSPAELVEKARKLIADPAACERMAQAGRARAAVSGYDVVSRMRELQEILLGALAGKKGSGT